LIETFLFENGLSFERLSHEERASFESHQCVEDRNDI